jgi:hypothetical protein
MQRSRAKDKGEERAEHPKEGEKKTGATKNTMPHISPLQVSNATTHLGYGFPEGNVTEKRLMRTTTAAPYFLVVERCCEQSIILLGHHDAAFVLWRECITVVLLANTHRFDHMPKHTIALRWNGHKHLHGFRLTAAGEAHECNTVNQTQKNSNKERQHVDRREVQRRQKKERRERKKSHEPKKLRVDNVREHRCCDRPRS